MSGLLSRPDQVGALRSLIVRLREAGWRPASYRLTSSRRLVRMYVLGDHDVRLRRRPGADVPQIAIDLGTDREWTAPIESAQQVVELFEVARLIPRPPAVDPGSPEGFRSALQAFTVAVAARSARESGRTEAPESAAPVELPHRLPPDMGESELDAVGPEAGEIEAGDASC